MSDVHIPDLLAYLKEWHTRNEIREKYSLSQTECQNLIRWLTKARLIIVCKGNYANVKKTNKTYLYKST